MGNKACKGAVNRLRSAGKIDLPECSRNLDAEEHKILLLGSTRAGKTTFVQQNDLTQSELTRETRLGITFAVSYIMQCARILEEVMTNLLDAQSTLASSEAFAEALATLRGIIGVDCNLSSDPTDEAIAYFQKTWEFLSPFFCRPELDEKLSNLSMYTQPNYKLTKQDLVLFHFRSAGIREYPIPFPTDFNIYTKTNPAVSYL
jgi:hypothetical protein